jgi:hypothetical protein
MGRGASLSFFIYLCKKTQQPMCYESLLGLQGCDRPEPTTGLYIDDLGINQTLLGQLITDQYNSGVELFEAKRAFAWRKMSSDILSRLNPMMKADTVVDSKRIGQVVTNAANVDLAVGAGKYTGIRVTIDPNTTSFLNFYLSSFKIDIYTMATPVEIFVYDMSTLKLIDSFFYQSEAVEQFIGKTFKANRRKMDLAFVYESLYDTTKMITKKGSCSDCGGNLRAVHICPFVDAIGIELTTDGFNVLSSKSKKYTQGMSMVYNVNCDREAWLCSIGGLMAMPLAYATAVEIYNYGLTISPNQRVNTVVSVNSGFSTSDPNDGMIAGRDIAATRYSEELAAMLQNMRLPDDNTCFDCRKNMKYVTALP